MLTTAPAWDRSMSALISENRSRWLIETVAPPARVMPNSATTISIEFGIVSATRSPRQILHVRGAHTHQELEKIMTAPSRWSMRPASNAAAASLSPHPER